MQGVGVIRTCWWARFPAPGANDWMLDTLLSIDSSASAS